MKRFVLLSAVFCLLGLPAISEAGPFRNFFGRFFHRHHASGSVGGSSGGCSGGSCAR